MPARPAPTEAFTHSPAAEANRARKAARLADVLVGFAVPLSRAQEPDVRKEVLRRARVKAASAETYALAVTESRQRIRVVCPRCHTPFDADTADAALAGFTAHLPHAHPKRQYRWTCASCGRSQGGYDTIRAAELAFHRAGCCATGNPAMTEQQAGRAA